MVFSTYPLLRLDEGFWGGKNTKKTYYLKKKSKSFRNLQETTLPSRE